MYVKELAAKVVESLRQTGRATLTNEQIVNHRDLGAEVERAIKDSGMTVSAEYKFVERQILYRREENERKPAQNG